MMEVYNLFDIAKPKQWKTISSEYFDSKGKYSVFGANGIIGKTNTYNHEEETVLITCRGATCGTVNLSEPYSYINGNAMALDDLDKSKAVTKYVYYFFQNYNFQNVITGSAQPQITREGLKNVEIPLPELETQNKIVTILDKAKAILDKRELTIQMYDELLRATFLSMFGNPMERPNRWSIVKTGKYVIDITAGTSLGGEHKKKLTEDELGVLKVSAVTKGVFDPREYKAVKRDLIKKEIIHPLKGDLLFSRANTLELVGATCMVHDNYNNLFLPDKIWKVVTNEEKLRKVFLHYVLRNKDVRKTFLSIATGSSGSMLNISMIKFKSIEIPLPPIELQLRFEAEYLKCIEIHQKLKRQCEFIRDLNNSLSKLAFEGNLKFNQGIDLEVLLENDNKFFLDNILNISMKTIEQLLIKLDKDELNESRFYEQQTYDKAKSFVFELIKQGRVTQLLDAQTKTVKLTVS
jgi:type I restriction enzyme S subunit